MTLKTSVSTASLKAEWSTIAAKRADSSGNGILEKALFQRDSIGISALVRIEDGMTGIGIRSPFRWMAKGWQVQRYAGIRLEPALDTTGSFLLPIFLVDLEAVDVFALLAADLVECASTQDSAEVSTRRILDRLALWLRFFRRFSAPLSRDEIRGLLGELKCLQLLIDVLGPDVALEAWKGPEGGLHDFSTDDCRIEVKTWGSDSSPRVVISEPGQIVIDEAWPVYLCGVQILGDDLNGVTLPEQIAIVRAKLPDGLKAAFEMLAADVGYLAAHSGQYHQRFTLSDCFFYRMEAGFPFIDPLALAPGIVGVRYSIELKALIPFLSESPFRDHRP
jgi:hypothetical protein